MHVGFGSVFQSQPGVPDHIVYQREIADAVRAEALGFDSAWCTEHHFGDYMLNPDPFQWLSYMAAATTRLDLGTMVSVLPWHDPMWVTEKIAMLDTLCGGRVILGVGRGTAPREYGLYDVDLETSRARFAESARMVINGLEQGYCEFDGTYIKQERADIRPRPFKSFRGRTYASAVSPESFPLCAELDVGLLFIPQKPLEQHQVDHDAYREHFLRLHQREPIPAIYVGWVVCDENEDRARELAYQHIGRYWDSAVEHYGMQVPDSMTEIFVNAHPWGTPEQVAEKITATCRLLRADRFVGVFNMVGMEPEFARANLELFSERAIPLLRQEQL